MLEVTPFSAKFRHIFPKFLMKLLIFVRIVALWIPLLLLQIELSKKVVKLGGELWLVWPITIDNCVPH